MRTTPSAPLLLHGARGEAWHYGLSVEAAALLRRMVIVETTGAALSAWAALKSETPGLIVQVPPSKPAHPCETAPAGVVLQ